MEPKTLQIVEGVAERVDFQFAAVARPRIDLANGKAAAQTPPRRGIDLQSQFGQRVLVHRRGALRQRQAEQALEQKLAHQRSCPA